MPNALARLGTVAATGVCIVLLALIFTGRELSELQPDPAFLNSFKIVFLSILLEALPFLLLGVVVSALLQSFVSDRALQRLVPRNPLAGVLLGALLGVVLPLCECGMIPIVRRLIRKGLPAYIGIVYIAAGPILNPVVVSATLAAFRFRPDLAYARFGLAFAVSVTLGFLLYLFLKRSPLKDGGGPAASLAPAGGHARLHTHEPLGRRLRARLAEAPAHSAEEFFEMGKYLILGAMITALLQTIVSREAFAAVAGHELLSHLFMMGFAYVLSLCSTSDAFVAASFGTLFPPAALLSFLVLGPMLDLKNTLMMLSVFRKRFVLKFSLIIPALVLAGALVFDRLGWV